MGRVAFGGGSVRVASDLVVDKSILDVSNESSLGVVGLLSRLWFLSEMTGY